MDELARRAEEFRVQVPATHAVQPACAPGQLAGRITDRGIAAILATYPQGDHGSYPHYGSAKEEGDYFDYDADHDGLRWFRPAEFSRSTRFLRSSRGEALPLA